MKNWKNLDTRSFRETPFYFKILLFSILYFLFMVVGYEFYYSIKNVAMFWPASGIYLSALLLSKQRRWVWILIVVTICQILVDIAYYDRVWYLGILFSLANSLEAFVGAVLIKRYIKVGLDAFTLKNIFTSIVAASLFAPLFGATFGTFIIIFAYGANLSTYWSIWGVWWASDFLGILIVVPAVLAWLGVNPDAYRRVTNNKKVLELCILILSLFLIEQYVFSSQISKISNFFELPYILIPFLLWATFSFSPRVVTSIMFFLVMIIVWNTDESRGIFVFLSNSPNEVIISMQSFLSIISISLLYLLALVNELRISQSELMKLNLNLEDRVKTRTNQLNAMNQELEAFSYSVSHDLQAPLRSIVGFSEILKEDYQKYLPTDGAAYLERIFDSGNKMTELIHSLLMLSRITRNELELEPVNISDLVTMLFEELKDSSLETSREIEVQVFDCGFVDADIKLLEVALRNLLINAIKFSDPLRVPNISFGSEEGNNGQVFYVRDNGIGIDMAYREKIFEPFQRLNFDSNYPGMGIGLSIVQRVIRRHGGEIWFESEIDVGTTFFFTLDSSRPQNF